jgi:CSLREA domain-containing protein
MAKTYGRFIYIFTLLAILMAQIGVMPVAAATPLLVNSTADAVDAAPGNGTCATSLGQCTLRAAIQEANALAGADTITLPAGTYNLTIPGASELLGATGDLNVSDNLTINGAGMGATIIDANGLDRALQVAAGVTLNLNNLTVRNGVANPGGGLLVQGSAIVSNVAFNNNQSPLTGVTGMGGGIYIDINGSATISSSLFTANSAGYGGGAVSSGTAGGGSSSTFSISDSTFISNFGGFGGGAIYPNGSSALVITSTFINNTANVGGAIHSNSTAVTVTNSTFVGNQAITMGVLGNDGALDARVGTITVNNSTFYNNSATGNGDTFGAQIPQGGALTVSNSILYGASTDNCVSVTDLGNNLSWPAGNSCPGTQADPLLGPLANNGGAAQTMALAAASPAINAGNNATCSPADQRGINRPQGAACDIGAFESNLNYFIVTNTADSGPGSLRQAISDANATPNSANGIDQIQFFLVGSGVQTISAVSALPAVTNPVMIDGWSQPGFSNTPLVQVTAVYPNVSSLVTVSGGGSTIRGLALNGFVNNGLLLSSSSNTVQGNFIGTDPAGTAAYAPGGAVGLQINNGSNNLIGGTAPNAGNLISGNYYAGVQVLGTANANQFFGNKIGTNAAGTAAIPNGSGSLYAGIFMQGSAPNSVSNTVIGGAAPGQRNIISGNNGDGVAIWDNVAGTLIKGNYIGVAADGVTPLGNNAGIDGGGITIRNFSSGNTAGGVAAGEANVIANNAPNGIRDYSGTNNIFRGNAIYNNAGVGIDLGGDGITFNHLGLAAGANNNQNYPVLTLASTDGVRTRVTGTLVSTANQAFTVDIYSIATCNPLSFGDGKNYLGSFSVNTDANGLASFDQTLSAGESEPHGITATATGPSGTSEFSYCRPASSPNLNWVQAQAVTLGSPANQYITDLYQEKWFKFPVQPGEIVHVQLTGQPGSAISLHRDPLPIYNSLVNPNSAASLSASAADSAFLPSGSLPSGSLPSGSLPSGSLPSGSLPSGSLPTGYLPSGSLPSGSLPSGSLPSGSLPSGSLPSGSLPSGSLPSGSLPSGSLPSGSLPSGSLPSGSLPSGSLPSGSLPSGSLPSGSLAAYASAARASLLGVSMNPYTTIQSIDRPTYDLQGSLYVRVVGPYNISTPFSLQVTVDGGACSAVQPVPASLAVISSGQPPAGSYKTLIVTDSARLQRLSSAADVTTAMSDLNALKARSDVNGLVIDLSSTVYQRVAFANAQADQAQNLACPSAKNTVASEIQAVINAYRAANSSLQYIVLAGGADVIPYFQVQDVAGLADEKNYVVPVASGSPSDAGLQTNLVRGQDGYGSQQTLDQSGFSLALPDLAVGRLVDNAADISNAVRNYIAINGVITPHSSLVTGYDFVADAAQAIVNEINQGTASTADTLIQPVGQGPTGANAWTATQLSNALKAQKHDIVSLSGHFSAGSLLASDYTTQLSAADLLASPVDLTNVLVLALGCHSGYAIPGLDTLANASPSPDWARAVLSKGAAGFVSASGYAYGDTELTEYGERLFVDLSQQLRTGTGFVTLGQALVAAKRQYLAQTAQLTGIDQKTIVEMTLYGLPMMQVHMTGQLISPATETSLVSSTTPFASGPAAGTGLTSTSVSLSPTVAPAPPVTLTNLSDNSTVTTTYLTGPDGVIANPYQPIFPKQIYNVDASNSVLRGVALRGGTYADSSGVYPLTSAPATETSVANLSYNTPVFYPNQTWMANFSDALTGGSTRLVAIPAQFQSRGPTTLDGTLRVFSQMSLQLYYLPNNWPTSGSAAVKAAAVSAAPAIQGVSASADSSNTLLNFSVTASADGAAGVQAVWVVYTGKPGSPFYGKWQPFDLAQNSADPTHWTGALTLPGGANPQDVLFMVQAVGGAGLTALSTNLGAYYSIAPANAAQLPPPAATTLSFQSAPSSGTYLKNSTFSLQLTSSSGALANQPVTLDIGGQQVTGVTDSSGKVSITIRPLVTPASYTAQASFAGGSSYLAASVTSPFLLNKDSTTLNLTPTSANLGYNAALPGQPTPFVAQVLDSSGNALSGRSLIFIIHNATTSLVRTVIADYRGSAALGAVPLPYGSYTVDVYFNGTIPTSPAITLSDPNYASSSRLGAALTFTDTTAPTITASAARADSTPYTAGTWSNQTVTVHFTCTDAGSGVASCPPDQVFAADGTFTANAAITDLSGNPAIVSFGPIKIDKTAPSITASAKKSDGSAYTAGSWTNQSVTVHFTCSDAGSGIATCPADQVFSLSGTFNANGTAVDNAGNTAAASFGPIQINKTTVLLRLIDSRGNGLAGGTAQYLDGTTLKNIPGSTNSNGDLATTIPVSKGTVSFTMTYVSGLTVKIQNVTSNSLVVFQTNVVTIQLKDHSGNPLDTGTVMYYAGGSWLSFGTTSGGKVTKELLPSVYGFRMIYANSNQDKLQINVSTTTVVFQTGQVHSNSGKATAYYANGAWRTFTQNMELLPQTYLFRFSDGTKDTNYTITAGKVNNIH